MKKLTATCLSAIMAIVLFAFPATAERMPWSESACIEWLRQSESLVLAEVISLDRLDQENVAWAEDMGYLCEGEFRFIRNVFGEKRPAGTYKLRGFFIDEMFDIGDELILEIRDLSSAERKNREVYLLDDYSEVKYDPGKYVIGLSKLYPVDFEDGSVGYRDLWLDSYFPSIENLVDKLSGKIDTNDLADYSEIPNEYLSMYFNKKHRMPGIGSEITFAKVNVLVSIYTGPDSSSRKIRELEQNARIVVYPYSGTSEYIKILCGNADSGYIKRSAISTTVAGSKPYNTKNVKLAEITKSAYMFDASYFRLPEATVRKGTTVVIGEKTEHNGNEFYQVLGGPQSLSYIPAVCLEMIDSAEIKHQYKVKEMYLD